MKISTLVFLVAACAASAADATFRFADGPGYRDLLFGDAPVFRHMYAYDAAKREETYKPYLHVYDPAGKHLITKGPGGQFTHHRGLFIGWNKTVLDGKTYDFWHCKGVERRHRSYVAAEEKADAKSARMVSVTEWPTADATVVVRETQRLTVTRPAEGKTQLDFGFTLEAPSGAVKLEGDPQHAGFHFRAAEEVQKGLAKYVRPDGAKDEKNDVWSACPWVAATFTVEGAPVTVAHLAHPSNPHASYSTRNYGRFGAFFTGEIAKEKPLTLRYRVIVQDRDATFADWAKAHEEFAKEK